MTTMGLQRRLVFCFLAITSLLGIYILCLSLEIRVPWRMVDLTHDISYTQGPIRSQDSEEAPGSNGEQSSPATHPKLLSGHERTRSTAQTATLKTQRASATAAEAAKARPLSGDVAGSNGKPGGDGGTGTTTKAPNLPPRPAPTHAVEATEPPYIGDTYTSENTPLQTDCPGSIRKKVPTTEFDGRFLRHIPVLQWAKHATPDQYRRLSRYPGAHGWGGIDYETLAASLSVLNSSANWLMFDDWTPGNKTRCIRCAVVGNGGILKNSKRGREIDRHDYVLRTNGAVIKGFEEDVGSRTTHYTFSTNTLRNSMRSYARLGYSGPPVSKETRYVFLPDHDRDYLLMKAAATHTPVARGPERSNSPPDYFGANVSAGQFKMYHPDFIRYLRNRFLRSHAMKTRYKDIYRPSTGAVMLLAAMHTCDQVNAYGFMTPDYSSYSDHYYDDVYRPVGFFINHDLRMEMNLWQQLHQAGLIQLYMRQ